jgi:drug/metabolite transporter (DMT)-like permease
MAETTGGRPTPVRCGLLLVVLAGVIWGTIGPAVQLVHDGSGLSPLTISAYRAVAAVTVLVLAAVMTGRLRTSWSLARQQWRRVIVVGLTASPLSWLLTACLGLVTMTVAYALLYTGLRTTPSGTAVVATSSNPSSPCSSPSCSSTSTRPPPDSSERS